MEPSDRDLLGTIEAHARERCEHHDPAHDFAHLQRVVSNSMIIMEDECSKGRTADEFVVLAGCWLHDIIQLPKGSSPPGESARQSSNYTQRFLIDIGIAEQRATSIAAAVRTHSYSGGQSPESREAAIIQDADRLDALGAVGIARLWVVARDLGSKLHHPDDPLANDRQLNDTRYGIDHITAKLLRLPALMNTDAGRRIARERADYVSAYREQFMRELGV